MPYHGNYKTPQDLILDPSLSSDEKIEMLEQWRADKSALSRASGEGMEGDDRSQVLKEIEKALALLSKGSPAKR